MIRRKLTASLKEKIKKEFSKLRLRDFDGEALSYLKKVRGAAKGRKAKKKKHKEQSKKRATRFESEVELTGKEKPLKIGKHTVDPTSKAYEIIILSARNKNQSLKKFVKENESAIEKLLDDYLIFVKSEIDNLIKQIRELPKKAKVFIPIHGKEKSRPRAIFMLHSIKKAMMELAAIYEVVFIEYGMDLYGDLHFNCPQPHEYKDIEDGDELLDWIDEHYPNITYIRND